MEEKPGARSAATSRATWARYSVLIGVAVALGLVYLILARQETSIDEPQVEVTPDDGAGLSQRAARLFYGTNDGRGLVSEVRWLDAGADDEQWLQEILRALIDGSAGGAVSSIPRETAVLEIFLDGLGGAYVNLTESLRSLHPPGDAMEWLTVRSIVATMTQNAPDIERVWILVDGEQPPILTGRVPLDRPYTWDDVKPRG